MKNFIAALILGAIIYIVNQPKSSSNTRSKSTTSTTQSSRTSSSTPPKRTSSTTQSSSSSSSNQTLQNAFRNKQSDVQVSGSGKVIVLLPDDTKGSKHQKFILKLASGQTVLIAHNIDLAPRINSLRQGNTVSFNGEYEWNSKGGVIHWTHHDPNHRHVDGWLKHNGKIYK